MANMIDTSALSDYVGIRDTDGPAALLSKDGPRQLMIKTATVGKAKGSGNDTIGLTLVVRDDDDKGAVLYRTLAVSGKTQGETPEANILQLGRLLESAGRTPDAIAALGSKKSVDLEAIAKSLTSEEVDPATKQPKNICYGYVRQNFNDFKGEIVSDVSHFIKRDTWDKAKSTGVGYRRDPNPGTPRARKGATNGAGAHGALPAPATAISDSLAEGI